MRADPEACPGECYRVLKMVDTNAVVLRGAVAFYAQLEAAQPS